MAGPTIAGQQIAWGTDSSTKYGMIQSITHSKGGNVKEYKDWQGDTKTLVISDKHDLLSIMAICLSSVTLPEYGEKVTVTLKSGSFQIYVQSAQVDWNNEDAARVTISGRTYPSVGGASGASA